MSTNTMLNWLNKKTNNSQISLFSSSDTNSENKLSSNANMNGLQEIKEKIGEARHYTPASQEWINSVYSYNKNFTKTLPATDNTVNRLIKSYFSLTPLFKGKKSKRVEIRFRRLSLNRILVSKSEIKHTNNKVIITVYLYNKNKKFIISKLKNLYKTFIGSIENKIPSFFFPSKEKNISKLTQRNNLKTISKNAVNMRKSSVKVSSLTRHISGNNMLKNTKVNLYKSKFSKLNKNKGASVKNTSKNRKLTTKRFKNSELNKKVLKLHNYVNFIRLTSKRLSNFFLKLKNPNLKYKYKTLMNRYYTTLNKYKLFTANKNKGFFLSFNKESYNSSQEYSDNSLYVSNFYNLVKGNIIGNISNNVDTSKLKTRRKIKQSRFKKMKKVNSIKSIMHKLRNFYNLFLLDNTFGFNVKNSIGITTEKTSILKNIYKILKGYKVGNTKKRFDAISLKALSIIKRARKRKNFILRVLKWKNEDFTNYEYRYYQNFIKKAYKKEILYMYYVKLLSVNNNKFKNWFILGFKRVVSKLYNKKVEFNFINLKYLHLNSDIFSESIATKLRNRENRLLTVLKKALKLVKLSSFNNKFTDVASNYTSKALSTKLFNSTIYNNDILHELLNSTFKQNNSSVNTTSTQTTDKRFLSIQKKNAVLDSIKHKSVFGVRLEATGRLSKRLTASRSVFKLKYKGSIKNIDSSYKGLSSVILKGNTKSNIQYTKLSSKTRNGSFGLKGWVSGY